MHLGDGEAHQVEAVSVPAEVVEVLREDEAVHRERGEVSQAVALPSLVGHQEDEEAVAGAEASKAHAASLLYHFTVRLSDPSWVPVAVLDRSILPCCTILKSLFTFGKARQLERYDKSAS